MDPADISHLLRRTEFVVRPERFAALASLPAEAIVDDILDVTANGIATLPAHLTADAADGWNQYVDSVDWWFQRMTTAPKPFQEKMTLFWHGHFTSSWYDVDKGYQMMSQNQLYRSLALGSFVDLTQQMAVHPAMLVYLSNADNVKRSPNQNFARELMELFTLGVGNYSEGDVDAAARAWTGHNYDRTTRQYAFRAAHHDTSNQTFFGRTQVWDGPQIVAEILTGAKQRIAATFIARKLWEFLAYVGPADHIVAALADVFMASGLQLRPLLRALLLRPEFYSATAKHGLVRSPIEFVAALSYHSGISAKDLGAAWRLGATGQAMFQPPNVSGWKPNGYWLNTSALSARAGFAEEAAWRLAEGSANDGLARNPNTRPNDPARLAAATTEANAAVDMIAATFGVTLSASSRRALLAFRLSETNTYWIKRNLIVMALMTPEFHVA